MATSPKDLGMYFAQAVASPVLNPELAEVDLSLEVGPIARFWDKDKLEGQRPLLDHGTIWYACFEPSRPCTISRVTLIFSSREHEKVPNQPVNMKPGDKLIVEFQKSAV